jgi:hypothetical protein
MRRYRVLSGFCSTVGDVAPGQVIELPDAEARFNIHLGRLALLEETPAAPPAPPTMSTAVSERPAAQIPNVRRR